MSIFKTINCKLMQMNHRCNKDEYLALQSKIEYYLNAVDKSQAEYKLLMKRLLEIKSTSDFYNVNLPTVDESQERNQSAICSLSPKHCEDNFESLDYKCHSLKYRLKDSFQKFLTVNELFKDIFKLHKENNEKEYFLKTNFDSDDNLICVYLPEFKKSSSISTIYLSYGLCRNHHNRSYMDVTYYSDGRMEIDELNSYVERKCHGAFMLQCLLEMVPRFNEDIEKKNQQKYLDLRRIYSSWDEFKSSINYEIPIKYIHGKIKPNRNLTREDLVRFYGRNGFIQNGRLYREV